MDLPEEDLALLDAKMSGKVHGTGVVHKGRSMELGFMSPDQVAKRLKELGAKERKTMSGNPRQVAGRTLKTSPSRWRAPSRRRRGAALARTPPRTRRSPQ